MTDTVHFLASTNKNPLLFVDAAFDWGRGELEAYEGPDGWQCDILKAIGDDLASGKITIQQAVASGHGIGKSALVSWLILWAMLTSPNTRGVVTANTEGQLRTKTWSEVAKWHRLLRPELKALLTYTATSLYVPGDNEKTWRMDAVPWSKSNPAAFAGLHNQGNRILLIFDEASEIDDIIWEVAEGALTDKDTEIMWMAFGNPTRNSGRFRECFGRFRHRWATRQVDSRSVKITNKDIISGWVADYGEDSDFVRVRVKGVFPRAGSTQFISSESVELAAKRPPESLISDPLVMGVDVARFGDDQSVIRFRRGRDAAGIKPIKFRQIDTMQLAGHCANLINTHRPDAIFIDEGGVGAGVIDRLRQLGYAAVGVNFGAKSDNPPQEMRCANKRAEIWSSMKVWMELGTIDNDMDLKSDLTGVQYGFNPDNAILLEKKEDMKKRGLGSPDDGDALALTFAYPVAPRRVVGEARRDVGHKALTEYDPYA